MASLLISERRLPRKQIGLSLIELMIALLLGTVLTLGVTQVFLGSSQTYRTSDAIAMLQENLRFSLSRLSRDARMAGHYGCLIGQPTEHLNTGSAAYNDELFNFERAVVGWDAPNTGLGNDHEVGAFVAGNGGWTNGEADTVPPVIANNAVQGSDILVLNGSVRASVTLADNPGQPANTIGTDGQTGIPQGTILVAIMGDCSGGDRFQKSNQATSSSITRGLGGSPGNTNDEELATHTDQSSVYTYRSTGYFVGIGAGGEPALFQVALEPGAADGNPIEIVSGVESLQLLYGVSQNERRAETYVPADQVDDWEDVVSVRFGLLMRSDDRILDEDNTRTFNLVGTEVDPGADRRARLVGAFTVGIRNRLE
ncbi:PilW family protein [Marinobacter zhanjiangensis]|uniref:Pilus assembly protein PilW n=1 Tax=Marinobacter zhanjiangensis TaxID=578215 RepID=A0ABQ3B9A6_9GAMM|nr:PilW family protein [Marinobacter zhanjiangensis]GGY79561.1 pilus assembly protein PilW [Marinobacter zhanjiangensis]